MSKVVYKQKNIHKSLIEQAAEQWVNLLFSQIVSQKNIYGLAKANKNHYENKIK